MDVEEYSNKTRTGRARSRASIALNTGATTTSEKNDDGVIVPGVLNIVINKVSFHTDLGGPLYARCAYMDQKVSLNGLVRNDSWSDKVIPLPFCLGGENQFEIAIVMRDLLSWKDHELGVAKMRVLDASPRVETVAMRSRRGNEQCGTCSLQWSFHPSHHNGGNVLRLFTLEAQTGAFPERVFVESSLSKRGPRKRTELPSCVEHVVKLEDNALEIGLITDRGKELLRESKQIQDGVTKFSSSQYKLKMYCLRVPTSDDLCFLAEKRLVVTFSCKKSKQKHRLYFAVQGFPPEFWGTNDFLITRGCARSETIDTTDTWQGEIVLPPCAPSSLAKDRYSSPLLHLGLWDELQPNRPKWETQLGLVPNAQIEISTPLLSQARATIELTHHNQPHGLEIVRGKGLVKSTSGFRGYYVQIQRGNQVVFKTSILRQANPVWKAVFKDDKILGTTLSVVELGSNTQKQLLKRTIDQALWDEMVSTRKRWWSLHPVGGILLQAIRLDQHEEQHRIVSKLVAAKNRKVYVTGNLELEVTDSLGHVEALAIRMGDRTTGKARHCFPVSWSIREHKVPQVKIMYIKDGRECESVLDVSCLLLRENSATDTWIDDVRLKARFITSSCPSSNAPIIPIDVKNGVLHIHVINASLTNIPNEALHVALSIRNFNQQMRIFREDKFSTSADNEGGRTPEWNEHFAVNLRDVASCPLITASLCLPDDTLLGQHVFGMPVHVMDRGHTCDARLPLRKDAEKIGELRICTQFLQEFEPRKQDNGDTVLIVNLLRGEFPDLLTHTTWTGEMECNVRIAMAGTAKTLHLTKPKFFDATLGVCEWNESFILERPRADQTLVLTLENDNTLKSSHRDLGSGAFALPSGDDMVDTWVDIAGIGRIHMVLQFDKVSTSRPGKGGVRLALTVRQAYKLRYKDKRIPSCLLRLSQASWEQSLCSKSEEFWWNERFLLPSRSIPVTLKVLYNDQSVGCCEVPMECGVQWFELQTDDEKLKKSPGSIEVGLEEIQPVDGTMIFQLENVPPSMFVKFKLEPIGYSCKGITKTELEFKSFSSDGTSSYITATLYLDDPDTPRNFVGEHRLDGDTINRILSGDLELITLEFPPNKSKLLCHVSFQARKEEKCLEERENVDVSTLCDVQELKSLFYKLDADDSGFVDRDEFQRGIQSKTFFSTHPITFEQIDTNEDGRLSWNEFQTALNRYVFSKQDHSSDTNDKAEMEDDVPREKSLRERINELEQTNRELVAENQRLNAMLQCSANGDEALPGDSTRENQDLRQTLEKKDAKIQRLKEERSVVLGHLEKERAKSSELRQSLDSVVTRLVASKQEKAVEQELSLWKRAQLLEEHERRRDAMDALVAHKEKEQLAANRLQASVRGSRDRKKFLESKARREGAARLIQSRVRGYHAVSKVGVYRAKLQAASICLQALFRAYKVQKIRKQEDRAACTIQRIARGASQKRLLQVQRKSAIAIQSAYRSHRDRLDVQTLRREMCAAIRIQGIVRGKSAKRLARALKDEKDRCEREMNFATTIQSLFRGHSARMQAKAQEDRLCEAAIRIQTCARRLYAREVARILQWRRKSAMKIGNGSHLNRDIPPRPTIMSTCLTASQLQERIQMALDELPTSCPDDSKHEFVPLKLAKSRDVYMEAFKSLVENGYVA